MHVKPHYFQNFDEIRYLIEMFHNNLSLQMMHFLKTVPFFEFRYAMCRSTPGRHAARPFQPKKHPNAQRKTRILKLSNRFLTDYF